MNSPVAYQRLEGSAILVVSTVTYFKYGPSWVYFAALFFSLDIFILPYLANPRLGAWSYNFGHSFITPSLLTAIYLFNPSHFLLGIICIWCAHIGFDRALGFGLKFASGFRHTHLGDIGKR